MTATQLSRLQFLLNGACCVCVVRSALSNRACLPPAERPPAGPNWLHEIKHDGFRIMARRDSGGVRLFTRNGNDFAARFPLAVAAVTALPAHSFLIDGEASSLTTMDLPILSLSGGRARRPGRTVRLRPDRARGRGSAPRSYRASQAEAIAARSHCRIRASSSMSTTTATAKSCSSTPANSAARVLSQSGSARLIAQGARRIGSRSKIRKRQP